MSVQKYVILGAPFGKAAHRQCSTLMWTTSREKKLRYKIALERQVVGVPLLNGPLGLELAFFFGYTTKVWHQRRNLDGKYQASAPTLESLVSFFCDVAGGILFTKRAAISHIIASKHYAEVPRTEVFLKRLDYERI